MYRMRPSLMTLSLSTLFWVSYQLLSPSVMASTCPPMHTLAGETAGDSFGFTMADVGDLNGDGWSELAIAAPVWPSGVGHCYVYSGQDQSLLFTITGEGADGLFGSSVAGADLDGDGHMDLIIGAGWYSAVWPYGGRVYVFYGSPAPWPDSLHASDADAFLDGDSTFYAAFGFSMVVLDDVDGDSCPDLAIGASQFNYDGVGISPGRVFVYSGRTLDTIYTLQGYNNADWFGLPLAVGDVNGDSLPDLLVGAVHDFNASSPQLGHVYAYSAPDGQLITTIVGGELREAFGTGLAGVGDVNADGFDDFAVGAHHYHDPPGSAPRTDSGRAFVYFGGPTLPDTLLISDAAYAYTGQSKGINFGGHISALGDINQDGHDDYAIAGWAGCTVRSAPGRVHLYSGSDGSEMFRLSDGVGCGNFGYWLARPWDLTGDGVKDLWIGAAELVTDVAGRANCYLIGDTDQDSLMSGCDNCPTDFNPAQEDADSDGYGDVCDICPRYDVPGYLPILTGDVNIDGTLTSADIIGLVNFVFKGGPPPQPISEAGDTDCSGDVTSADIIQMVNHVFKGGAAPCDVCALITVK